jgi:hypothetical protein
MAFGASPDAYPLPLKDCIEIAAMGSATVDKSPSDSLTPYFNGSPVNVS